MGQPMSANGTPLWGPTAEQQAELDAQNAETKAKWEEFQKGGGSGFAGMFAAPGTKDINEAKYTPEEQAAYDAAVDQFGYSAGVAASDVVMAGRKAKSDMEALGASATSAMNTAGSEAQGVGAGARLAQEGLAANAGDDRLAALANAGTTFNGSGIGESMSVDAGWTLRGSGRLGGMLDTIEGADVTSGLNSAQNATQRALTGNQNANTDELARFAAGNGVSTASLAAADRLKGQQPIAGMSAAQQLSTYQGDRGLLNNLAGHQGERSQLGALTSANIGSTQVGSAAAGGTSGLSSMADYLRGYSGPSEAEIQMDRALGQNVNAQFALANSGRGAYNGQAMRRAQATAASMGQETASAQAALRAQEEATRNQLAVGAYGELGSLGNAQDAMLQQNDALRLQQLQAGLSGEQALNSDQLSAMQAALQGEAAWNSGQLSALQSAGDLAVANDQARLNAASQYAGATATNDQIRLAAKDQDLRAQIAAAQAAGQDTSNLVALLNANTAAAQAASGGTLSQLDLLAQSSGAADVNDTNRASALGEVASNLSQSELAAYQAEQAAQQGWYGQALQAGAQQSGMLEAGYGQELEGTGQNIDATATGQQLSVGAQVQAMVQNMGAQITASGMIVSSEGIILGSIQDWYSAEADRRSGIATNNANLAAAQKMAQDNRDAAQTQQLLAAAGAAAGMVAGGPAGAAVGAGAGSAVGGAAS